MQALIVLAVTFLLLWVFFILPQQRRVRAHHQLVAGLEAGDEVVLTAGIHGRITELGAEDLLLEVAPGVELRVARQAVLRRVETVDADADAPAPAESAVTDGAYAGDGPASEARPAGSDVATPTDPT
ncbi:MAG TPA: preprotein translocase subunit YajC [Acidimicrobiales bacterium]|nr:preprotein translocase subunit YajC [Acidimicrobiales bacterium]